MLFILLFFVVHTRGKNSIIPIITKKKLIIKDKKIRDAIKKSGRKGIKKDFFELLKRAVETTNN